MYYEKTCPICFRIFGTNTKVNKYCTTKCSEVGLMNSRRKSSEKTRKEHPEKVKESNIKTTINRGRWFDFTTKIFGRPMTRKETKMVLRNALVICKIRDGMSMFGE